MNKVTLPQNKTEILNKTGQNLGIPKISNGSYLQTLLDGLTDFNATVTEEINSVIGELSLETASMATLEEYGARKGIPKMKNRNLATTSRDMVIFLRPIFYKEISDLTVTLFIKNQVIKSDIFLITILEDVVYNSNSDRVYISCSISINDLYEIPFNYLEQDKVLKLVPPVQYQDMIEQLTLEVERSVAFSSYTESETTYRQRLLQAMKDSNISGESYILSILNSIPYVDQYYIEKDSYPNKVFLLNNLMYVSEEYEELLDESTLVLGTSLIDDVKTYGSNFELEVAEKVSISLSINIELGESNAGAYLLDFSNHLRNKHTLGRDFVLDKDFIDLFFRTNGEYSVNFNLEISLYFNGITIPNENAESLIISKSQYPFISQLLYNGVNIYEL